MPIGTEDRTPLDISGDPGPTTPMNQKQVAGAQKASVNRTQLPSANKGPAGKPPASADGKPDDKTAKEGDQAQQQQAADASTEQPAHGIVPAFHALVDGIGAIQKDPEWMQHPLLRLFADPTSDPGQIGQDLWGATQWWGRVVNAALDPNAIHASAASLEHDNGISGHIASAFFGINSNPVSEMAWNLIPSALSMSAEWPAWWAWGPQMAANAPSQLSAVPSAAMALFGGDLKHPAFNDPAWYERMGSYVIAAALTAKGGGKAVGPLMKFTGRLRALERRSR